MTTYQLRLGTPADLAAVLDLIDNAAAWLRTQNTNQWSQPWPTRRQRDARVLRGILAQGTWLVERRGAPVATVTYHAAGNADIWKNVESPEPACYMSRLVLNREFAGQEIGTALIDWVGLRAREEYGATSLRIDVWTDNLRLHRYYEDRGFLFLGLHSDETYPSRALFSRPTAEIKMPAMPLLREIRALTPPA
jgi:ribosomal protein S18 acetylase RimI-like enzyme